MGNEPCPRGWRVVSLGDLGQVGRGRSRHRPRYAQHLYGGPYPFIQTGDIKASGGRITTYQQSYSEAGLAQSRLWPAGTLCITIAANIAETGILTFPACFPDSVVGFIADGSKCDVRFVEYVFRRLRQRIQREATGTVQDNINLRTLDSLRFPVPSPSDQRAIADVLGTLDDKIEVNRRMNETLEAMARAIFKSWFIDLDPVQAKAEGRQPACMDAQTAALFPDEFEEAELGEIPRGWRVGTFADIADIVGGGTPKTSVPEYWDGDIPWFSVVDAPSPGDIYVIDTQSKITERGLANCSARLLGVGTTIISARGTVGKLALVGTPMAMNQSCYGLLPKKGGGPLFLYFASQALVWVLQQRTHGSVFDTVTRDTFNTLLSVVPPRELEMAFERAVEPLLQRILNNLRESRTLAAIRDGLLPRLLSGELRVVQGEIEQHRSGVSRTAVPCSHSRRHI